MNRLILLLCLSLSNNALSHDVVPKVGDSCPTGTYSSGDYCKTFGSAEKRGIQVITNPSGGKCPTGWYRSGDYCKAYSKRAADEEVIEKVGDDCPTGMYSSGSFCKSYR